MITYRQLVNSPTEGDCYRTCVACILELPVESVPIYHGPEQSFLTSNWLEERFGLSIRGVTVSEGLDPRYFGDVGYTILTVPSLRYEGVLHAVVGHTGKIVHDPAGQSIEKYGGVQMVEFFVVNDPVKVVRRLRGEG